MLGIQKIDYLYQQTNFKLFTESFIVGDGNEREGTVRTTRGLLQVIEN